MLVCLFITSLALCFVKTRIIFVLFTGVSLAPRIMLDIYVFVTNDQTFSLISGILSIMILAHGLQWSQFSQDSIAHMVQAEV